MSKRKVEVFELEYEQCEPDKHMHGEHSKKHTLDSDEEDSGDDERYNIMNENDIVGEEEGVSGIEGETKFTPFNMKEELEEGHFDREGHFQWDKKKEIRDNWLDNIDWVKVKTDKNYIEKTNRGLADSSDSEDDESKNFNEIEAYKKLFEFMKLGETVKKTLQRLGSKTLKLSSAERWRRKKSGIVDENAELVTKFTELANDILTNTGNMDIYEETYEMIEAKINKKCGAKTATGVKRSIRTENVEDLDMYADDFDSKEKSKLITAHNKEGTTTVTEDKNQEEAGEEDCSNLLRNQVLWEYKWKQEDTEIHGPFTTEQMQQWVDEDYFKGGIFVRKVGEKSNFYSSTRIDFELYL